MDKFESRNSTEDSNAVVVLPVQRFKKRFEINTYKSREEWWTAAMNASQRMYLDEAFRKEIEQFLF